MLTDEGSTIPDMGMGERIKERREALRLSLRDLAKKVHRSHGAVANWEKGADPSVDLDTLAKALQTSVRWLRDGEETPPPPEVDMDILVQVIVAVEKARNELGLDPPPEKRADVIATLYALSLPTRSVDLDLARRLVRMAA